jgi:hypothetical protein
MEEYYGYRKIQQIFEALPSSYLPNAEKAPTISQ